MVTNVNKIDSNVVELRVLEEATPGVLPGSPVWTAVEPNSFSDFGAQISITTREPIASDRQRKKGVVTDLDASGGYGFDLTMENFQLLAPGFFFKAMETNAELAVTDTNTTLDDYQPASGGDDYYAGDLLWAKDFDDAGNNGLKNVTGTPSATSVPVSEELLTASTQSGTISKVGHQFASGDLTVDVATGPLPRLVTAAGDMTEMNLVVGQWIYIGGDLAAEKFAIAATNNGFARIRSIATTYLELDKHENTMLVDAGTGKTIRLFFGRAVRNGSLNKTFQFERKLGVPDTGSPANEQATYLTGMKGNEFTINIPQTDKVTMDVSFIGNDEEIYDGPTVLKSGTRPALVSSDAINTSSDVSRIKLALTSNTDENPTAMFAYVTDLTISVNNNLDPNKAIGVLGAFDITPGNFEASASVEAYFTDTASISAVRANSQVTLDAHLVANNKGVSLDMPAFALGDGRPNIEKDQPVKLPLTAEGYDGTVVDASLNHTMLMMFWDYLPTAAG
jgi:hypothetical protein